MRIREKVLLLILIVLVMVLGYFKLLYPAFPKHSTMKFWHRCRKLVVFL